MYCRLNMKPTEEFWWTVLQFIAAIFAFFFSIFFAVFLIKICVACNDYIGFVVHYCYWKFSIWWYGWDFDVPDYWNEFDLDEYIDNLIEMEMARDSDSYPDSEYMNNYIIVINPNGKIDIGKPFKNSN